MDVATDQLDRLIERRSDKAVDPDELEPSYAESVRRFHARRREQHRWEWIRYFERMAKSLRERALEYDGRAAKLLDQVSEEERNDA